MASYCLGLCFALLLDSHSDHQANDAVSGWGTAMHASCQVPSHNVRMKPGAAQAWGCKRQLHAYCANADPWPVTYNACMRLI